VATILRGKRKGEEVTLNQFCNDWVTAADKVGNVKVFKITALQFTNEEIFTICGHQNTGIMFNCFEVIPFQNRFRKKKIEKLGRYPQ